MDFEETRYNPGALSEPGYKSGHSVARRVALTQPQAPPHSTGASTPMASQHDQELYSFCLKRDGNIYVTYIGGPAVSVVKAPRGVFEDKANGLRITCCARPGADDSKEWIYEFVGIETRIGRSAIDLVHRMISTPRGAELQCGSMTMSSDGNMCFGGGRRA